MKVVIRTFILLGIAGLISACSHSEKDMRFSPSSKEERALVAIFKNTAGENRRATWQMLEPLLTNRLASVSRNQTELKSFFEQWLGPSERNALSRSESAVVWALSPQPNAGDVFAYQLKNETNAFEDLVVDFRNPNKIQIGISSSYMPLAAKGPQDQISKSEKQIAAELGAIEINLGVGSPDGSAKPGFSVKLEGTKANEENVRKAAQLTTLVSLELTGKGVTDACLMALKGHSYLAQLELNSTSVSDAGLSHIASLSSLKWLTVKGGTITESQVNALRSMLPKCEVDFQKQ